MIGFMNKKLNNRGIEGNGAHGSIMGLLVALKGLKVKHARH
jgi:hypothetical protein